MNKKTFAMRAVLQAAIAVFLPLSGHGADGGTWAQKANMPTPRVGLATCVVDGKIYAIGGYKQAGASAITTVEVYDPVTDSWTKETPMPTARVWPTAAAANGKIYVIGGSSAHLNSANPSTVLQRVDEYDPATGVWTRKTAMPSARMASGSVMVNGKIYVVGGFTSVTSPLSTVEAYDPVTDKWESKAKMPTRRGLLSVTAVNGKIYAIGSSQPGGPWLGAVETYDPSTDTWTRKRSMPTARGTSAASAVHGRIYVMGGRNCCTSFSTVEEYDPVTDEWAKRADMRSATGGNPIRRWVLSASEVNGRIYALGGAYEIAQPHPGISLVLEYTPPLLEPRPEAKPVRATSGNVLRLEWSSRSDCFDLLQTQNSRQPGAWADIEQFSGTGSTLSYDAATDLEFALYRLVRERR